MYRIFEIASTCLAVFTLGAPVWAADAVAPPRTQPWPEAVPVRSRDERFSSDELKALFPTAAAMQDLSGQSAVQAQGGKAFVHPRDVRMGRIYTGGKRKLLCQPVSARYAFGGGRQLTIDVRAVYPAAARH